ncbi:MAG: adenosylcobalamin-dependent ribonucleoside-diphosphate reductase [Bryobacteraceae bacterium]|jgi:ribonucleoside-diphosphate reductase alpha chain
MAPTVSENGLRVLTARYLRRDGRGQVVETPDQLFERVARAVSDAELIHGTAADARRWEARFHSMIAALDFLPNSPTLMNAGTPLGQLSACFVLPIEDTMESIFGTLRDAALIQRTGGGTGFSFSRLRPAGDLVHTTGGASSGPVSFMRIYDCATENIKLGGRRRGANMGVLRVDHPDIEEFIRAKRDGVSLRNFNISVGITDAFMQAVESGKDWALRHPAKGCELRRLSARRLFDEICEAAWATGDPGLIFLDTIARANPVPASGAIEATNPCGELPLLPYEACNLGSINLTHFIRQAGSAPAVDWERLREQTWDAVRFLDDVISVNRFPLEEVARATLANRRIGLGVMGFAELCILLGISYAGERAVQLASELMGFIAREAGLASVELAEERGVFPNWGESVYAVSQLRRRNATQTSIAPTGTISIIAGTSSGIEPLFALAYRRQHVLGEQTLVELNPLLVRHCGQLGGNAKETLDSVSSSGRLKSGDPERLFITALEIPPEQHVRIQAAFQQHVDNAVSKTVNLPEDATPEEVARVYRLAHQLGCKGVTVFRYGSKTEATLQLGLGESPEEREYFTRCDPGACRL